MRRFAYIFVPLWVCAFQVSAAVLRYEGKVPADKAAIERRVSQMRLTAGFASDSVTSWLVADGYLDAQVTTQSDTVVVNAGTLCRLVRVQAEQDSAVTVAVNIPFTRDNLESAVNQILNHYYLRGFYYAHATASEVRRDGNDITVVVTVAPGPLVRVAGNLREGLARTRPKVLDRYLAVHVGDTLTDSTLRVAEQAAAEIPFVNFSPPVTVVPRAGYTDADLEYRFSEKKQFTFFGGMGYLPTDRTGLVWNLNVKATNLFGDGREFSIISERRELGRNLLNVSYGQPWFILGLGWFNVSIATRDYRDQFYEFGADIAYKTKVTQHLTVGTALGWKRVDPVNDQPSFRRFTAEFDLTREALDDRINPRRGGSVHGALTYAYRTYQADSLAFGGGGAAFNETRANLSLVRYQPIAGNLVTMIGVNYAGLETGEKLPPVSELVLIGGPGTLRGYRNEQFAVQRSAFGTIEPRIRFSAGYLFLFYDAAYLNYPVMQADSSVTTEQLYRYGYGAGFALTSGERSVKLSLGWNPTLGVDQPWLSVQFSSDL